MRRDLVLRTQSLAEMSSKELLVRPDWSNRSASAYDRLLPGLPVRTKPALFRAD